jgi:hypothetical protein
LDDGLAGAELGDDGDEAAFGGGGNAAVGPVVAEPDDGRDLGIVVGEVEGGDVGGDAVDEEPGAGLPGPARRFGGEGVVDAEGAADDEGAVGDVVDFAYGPLFLGAVDEERADAEGGGVFGLVVWGGFGRGVGDFAGGAEVDGVGFGRRGEDWAREDEQQWHESRAKGLHGWKSSRKAGNRKQEIGSRK